ncbi:MAG: putative membrane protein [Candidatus Nanosalina sp. J07AB43]|nr:MAG: putative membrane protein [Candidatus Nanosalina sp. J07AB43]
MLDVVKAFLFEKFWLPIIDESIYYNPYNTALYAIVFGILVIYVLKPLIQKRMNLKINKEFVLGFTPFIVFGGAARALKDVKAFNTILLETPFIYGLLILLGTLMLYGSKKIEAVTQKPYYKTLAVAGTAALFLTLPFYTLEEPRALSTFLTTVPIWAVPGYLILKAEKPGLLNWDFALPVSAHLLDATSTFTALRYGADEKHVLGRIAVDVFGDWGLFPLKLGVIIPVVHYIRESFDGEEKAFYIFIITALGLGIATRNTLQTLAIS